MTYLTEMIGSNLGWLNIPVCALLAMGYLLILVLQVSGNDDISGIRLDFPAKGILGGVSLLVFALIFVTLYGQWTAYGYDKILGVQGRYFSAASFSADPCAEAQTVCRRSRGNTMGTVSGSLEYRSVRLCDTFRAGIVPFCIRRRIWSSKNP